jgi:hypothetical protein
MPICQSRPIPIPLNQTSLLYESVTDGTDAKFPYLVPPVGTNNTGSHSYVEQMAQLILGNSLKPSINFMLNLNTINSIIGTPKLLSVLCI